ncbi:MAG: Ig-like domain-containing protein [Gemmatimonadetes bacterium]|nr:Ig-like domain-containing protein [Gemmatimonadota bacterium]
MNHRISMLEPRRGGVACALVTLLLLGGCTIDALAPGRVARILVEPAEDTLLVGERVRFAARALNSEGRPVPDAEIQWSSLGPAIATVDKDGIVTGITPGTTAIVATNPRSGGTQGVANVTVELLTFAAADAGYFHTCGILPGGAPVCWGLNTSGQRGSDPNAPPCCAPAVYPVMGGLVVVSVSAGGGPARAHTCALTAGGAAFCWGDNSAGQLGDSTTTSSARPVMVQGVGNFAAISAGYEHTCGVTRDGEAYCWGKNSDGQLGDGTRTPSSRPVRVTGGLRFATVSAGSRHTCGVAAGGEAYCWGDNSQEQLGTGSTQSRLAPARVSGGTGFQRVLAGDMHSCGLAADGRAYCWGANFEGQLGRGSHAASATPVAVAGARAFVTLEVGRFHTCGLTAAGAVYCWGWHRFGQLGVGADTGLECHQGRPCSIVPVEVAGGLSFKSLTAGGLHSCGVAGNGTAYCWGFNGAGELGSPRKELCVSGDDPANVCSPVPVPVTGQATAPSGAAPRAR